MDFSEIYRQLHGSDQLAVIFEAARRTEDEQYYNDLLALVDSFIAEAQCSDEHSLAAIRSKLLKQKGTPLEPFILSERNLELAARFIQLVLTVSGGARRVRIGSEDAIGTRGGVVMDAGLRCRHLQRLLGADSKFDLRRVAYMLPNSAVHLPAIYEIGKPIERVLCRPDDEYGFVLEMVLRDIDMLRWSDVRHFSPHTIEYAVLRSSFIEKPSDSLYLLGMHVELIKARSCKLLVYPSSPEAMVRFSALLMSQKLLLLQNASDSPGSACIEIKLDLNPDGPLDLDFEVRRNGPCLNDTMDTLSERKFDLPEYEIEKVFAELRPSMSGTLRNRIQNNNRNKA